MFFLINSFRFITVVNTDILNLPGFNIIFLVCDPFEDSATKHLCLPSCNKCISNEIQGDMKLIDIETSSLKEKYIDSLVECSFVLGNLDLVGWVIIKNSFKSKKMSMQPLKKLKDLCDF